MGLTGICIGLARRIRTGCWLVLAALARVMPQQRKRDARPVLVVLRPDAIGDYILFRPWLRWLREASPWAGWKIVLAGNTVWREFALDFDSGCFDEALWLDRRRLMRSPLCFFRLARRLHRSCPDLLVYPVVSREILGDLLVRASGARQAIAAECDGINLEPRFARRSDRWYARLVPVAARGFEFYRTRDFFGGLCAGLQPDFPRDSRIDHAALCGRADAGSGGEVLLFPGAGDPRRCWPAGSWSRVAQFCVARGLQVFVCGSNAERALCQEVAACSGGESLAGSLGWKELVLRVSQARLVLCHDSMALHLALACSVPVVCISNGNHYGRFVPYPDHLLKAPLAVLVPPAVLRVADPESFFARGSDEDICGVSVDAALQAVRTLLEMDP